MNAGNLEGICSPSRFMRPVERFCKSFCMNWNQMNYGVKIFLVPMLCVTAIKLRLKHFKVPSGTTDNSPAIHCRVGHASTCQAVRDSRIGSVSVVPDGTWRVFIPLPGLLSAVPDGTLKCLPLNLMAVAWTRKTLCLLCVLCGKNKNILFLFCSFQAVFIKIFVCQPHLEFIIWP